MIDNAPYNLANLIAGLATRYPRRLAIATTDSSVTYAQLRDLSANLADRLREIGVRRGSCVALDINHPVVGIALTVSCAMLGCSWVHGSLFVLQSQEVPISHLLHDGVHYPPSAKNIFLLEPHWVTPRRTGASWDYPGYATPRDTWMIAQSSGTTGTPKFMALDEVGAWWRTTKNVVAEMPTTPVFLCMFAALSQPGILHSLRVLAIGGTVVFGALEALFGRVRIDCVLGAPNHFANFLASAPKDLPRIPLAIVAGAVARRAFLAQMLRYVEAISYMYASTEASIVCTNLVRRVDDAPGVVGAGYPVAGAEIRIVAENGSELAAGQEGIVKLRTPGLAAGYLGNPELTSQVFRDGWFYPGDLGFLTNDGELYITGRVSDHLNFGGVKFNAETIDAILLSTAGVRDGACFVLPTPYGIEQLVVGLVLEYPEDLAAMQATVAAIRATLTGKYGPALAPQAVFSLPAIPRNQNGKLDRGVLPAAVRGLRPIDMPPA